VYPPQGSVRDGHLWSQFLMLSPGEWLTDRVESEGQRLVSFEALAREGKLIRYRGKWAFRDLFTSAAEHYVRLSGEKLMPVSRFGATRGRWVPAPISLGGSEDQVALVLYGAGVRGRAALSGVKAEAGGENCQVFFAGPHMSFAGLDQVNLWLPRSLRSRGEVEVLLTVEGIKTNAVTVRIE